MSKSVVIIGKGPSVVQSTKEFIDSFDEVALCNFPPMEGYEQHIGNRATYHFLNAHDPNPYKSEILNSLGLKFIFNTHYSTHDGRNDIFPNHKATYFPDYGEKIIPEFKKVFDFDPSCGIMAFDFFVRSEEIDTIGLVGFDFFKVGERGYYYSQQEVQPSLQYLYNSNGSKPFNEEGIRLHSNPHDSEKSIKFVEDMIKVHNKKLILPT